MHIHLFCFNDFFKYFLRQLDFQFYTILNLLHVIYSVHN